MVAACEHQQFFAAAAVQSRRGRGPCVPQVSVSARADVSCDLWYASVPAQGSAAARLPRSGCIPGAASVETYQSHLPE